MKNEFFFIKFSSPDPTSDKSVEEKINQLCFNDLNPQQNKTYIEAEDFTFKFIEKWFNTNFQSISDRVTLEKREGSTFSSLVFFSIHIKRNSPKKRLLKSCLNNFEKDLSRIFNSENGVWIERKKGDKIRDNKKTSLLKQVRVGVGGLIAGIALTTLFSPNPTPPPAENINADNIETTMKIVKTEFKNTVHLPQGEGDSSITEFFRRIKERLENEKNKK